MSHEAVTDGPVAARPGSPLRLDVVELAPGEQFNADPEIHSLVYLLTGELELTIGSERVTLTADTAFLCDGDPEAGVRARTPARLAVFGAAATCDEHAPIGARTLSTPLELDRAESATGSRGFQVLLGPETGCTRATMFVGVVPPGAAPWHFHQYDEIVYLLDGTANYRQGDGDQTMTAGCAVRIPPRTVHINANVTDAPMRVLGVFTPAGSPSAAYLADDPRPAAR